MDDNNKGINLHDFKIVDFVQNTPIFCFKCIVISVKA